MSGDEYDSSINESDDSPATEANLKIAPVKVGMPVENDMLIPEIKEEDESSSNKSSI